MQRSFWAALAVCLAWAGSAIAQAPRATQPVMLGVLRTPADANPALASETLQSGTTGQTPCAPRFWARAEYLYWWVSGDPVPPLATLGSPADPVPGALGQPGTTVLFDHSIN